MERGNNNNTENRKRPRDDDQEDGKKECHVSKKQETSINPSDQISSSYNKENKGCGRFCDAIFDFPWLKDGSVFEANEFLKHDEDMFAHIVEGSLVNPGDDRCFQEYDEFEGDGLRSFEVDDFEPLDCVWSSVMDQPIDANYTCLNN